MGDHSIPAHQAKLAFRNCCVGGGFLRLQCGDYVTMGLGIFCFVVRGLRTACATFGRAYSVKLPLMKSIWSRACEGKTTEVA